MPAILNCARLANQFISHREKKKSRKCLWNGFKKRASNIRPEEG